MNSKEEQLSTLEELQNRLNGSCSDDLDTCPYFIGHDLFRKHIWDCDDCKKMFVNVINLSECMKDSRLKTMTRPCPCSIAMTGLFKITTQDVLQRLDEYIEELRGELY